MMNNRIANFLNRVLTETAQQLQLCCSREVGNMPMELLRRHDRRWK